MHVLLPLPDRDFDTTEVAVPWQILTEQGHQVTFATERGGLSPHCDPLLLTGVLLGRLGARPDAIEAYRHLRDDEQFRSPVSWHDLEVEGYDAVLLPGGHAPGMRQYLGSKDLQTHVGRFWATGRPVAAICHGVLVLARSVDPATGRSVLYDRRTTCLPKYMERGAYVMTCWLRGRYYRTYPTYVQDEVCAALRQRTQFERGPRVLTARGTEADDQAAFVVQDRNYLSARWPGDAFLFARRLAEMLTARATT